MSQMSSKPPPTNVAVPPAALPPLLLQGYTIPNTNRYRCCCCGLSPVASRTRAPRTRQSLVSLFRVGMCSTSCRTLRANREPRAKPPGSHLPLPPTVTNLHQPNQLLRTVLQRMLTTWHKPTGSQEAATRLSLSLSLSDQPGPPHFRLHSTSTVTRHSSNKGLRGECHSRNNRVQMTT